jgi:hypothetical protein
MGAVVSQGYATSPAHSEMTRPQTTKKHSFTRAKGQSMCPGARGSEFASAYQLSLRRPLGKIQ